MEEIITYICEKFKAKNIRLHKRDIQVALKKYFGISGQATTDQALVHYDEGFDEGGSGVSDVTLVKQQDGSYVFNSTFSFTIRAEYEDLIPIIASNLGYVAPVVEE